jgi:hypothetical protein
MARKLALLVGVIGLATLMLAPASFATTYHLGPQGDDSNYYIWNHIYTDKNPWDAGTEFMAGSPRFYASVADWRIGYDVGDVHQRFVNTNEGNENQDGSYTIVFDSTTADPNFFINMEGIPPISSNDTIITYNVEYEYKDRYTVKEGTIIVDGTDSGTGDSFRVTASLVDLIGNHQNMGYMTSFDLEYPYNASAVPIPGAMWLFGTGLLGLFSLKRRFSWHA